MNAILIYLAESALSLAVFYAIYWLFLRKETFFRVNRFYLLSMITFSFVFPLLPAGWIPSAPSATMAVILEPVLISPGKMDETLGAHVQWVELAGLVYFTGILVFLLRFLVQLAQIYLIARRFGISSHHGLRVVFVDRGYAPFSFFNLVFINRDAIPSRGLAAVLEHEHVHTSQFHSADMILVELARAFQWFNPAIWLAGREMKCIHEFLADEGVLQNGISRSTYQQMILNATMGIELNDLTNHFNVSLLKKRIAMMTKPKSNTWAKSKLLFALPAILGLLFVVSVRSHGNTEALNTQVSTAVNLSQDLTATDRVARDQPKAGPGVLYTAPVTQDKKVYKKSEKMPSYPGGSDAMIKFLVSNIKYPEEAKKNKVTGTVFVSFIVRADGSVTDVKVLRGIGSGCDEEAVRVIKLMPNWEPGVEKGKAVDVMFNLPIKFNLDDEKKEEPKI